MFKKIRVSIDSEFKKYVFSQIFFYLVITFVFFVFFFFNFGLVLAGFIVWVMFFNMLMFLYLDIKFSFETYNQEKRIDNLEDIIKNIK